MPTYTPIVIPNSNVLTSTDLNDNFSDFREILNVEGLETSNFSSLAVTTETIAPPRITQATGTGWAVYLESGYIETRSQGSAELRAPAINGAWTPPAGWEYYEPDTTRNINTANRPHNGVIDTGPVPGSSCSITLYRKAWVVITCQYHLAPMHIEAIPEPADNDAVTVLLDIRYVTNGGTPDFWLDEYVFRQPWVTVDTYLHSNTIRLAHELDPGTYSFFLRLRDPDNDTSYTFVGASHWILEAYNYE